MGGNTITLNIPSSKVVAREVVTHYYAVIRRFPDSLPLITMDKRKNIHMKEIDKRNSLSLTKKG